MPSYTAADLDHIQVLYCTASLGMHPSHSLCRKLKAISAAGFTGIELGFDDLVQFAQDAKEFVSPLLQAVSSDEIDSKSQAEIDEYYGALEDVCEELRKECDELGLEIFCLQPFSTFEGYNGPKREQNADTTTDPVTAVKDLQELADIASEFNPPINIAYENWCWAAHFLTWKDIWSVSQQVDRPNFGLCVDTFQSAGSEFADPATRSGFIESSSKPFEKLEHDWKESCKALSTTVPAKNIFYLQISDAARPEPRITKSDGINGTRGQWSHGFRPLPYSKDGYLPWMDFMKDVLETGFVGPVSTEVFENEMQEEGWEMEVYAKRAMEVWSKLKTDLMKE